MKKISFLSVTFASLCMLFMMGCTSRMSRVQDRLRRAEELATVAPDSAFAILDEIRSDTSGSQETRSQYDLVWAEAFYMKYRDLTDSVDEVLSRIHTTPGTKPDVMKKILHATHLFWKDKKKEAFSLFDSCSRELGDDIGLYWKGLVESYLAIICTQTRFYPQAKVHSYKLLEYAEALGDPKVIANAYSHLGNCYHAAHEPDSALYFATKVLSNKEILDSHLLATAYHNLYVIQMSMPEYRKKHNLDIVQVYNRNRIRSSDSTMTQAFVSQAYYLAGQTDSAWIFQQKVEGSSHNIAKYIMYKFLSDYYQEQEVTDSALKYLRLYNQLDSLCVRSKSVEPLLNAVYTHNQDAAERQFRQQKIWIVAVSVFVIVLGILTVVWLRIRHKRRISSVISDAESSETHLREELDSVQNTLQDTRTELEETTGSLSMAHRKIENYQTLISKKNSRLAQAHRDREKFDSNKKVHSQATIQSFLDKGIHQESKMNKNQMQYIIDSYGESATERHDFLHSLMRSSERLTPTGILICILYHEGFSDEEIISKLHYDSNNYRTAKSRARAAIDTPNNAGSPIIRELLQSFEHKKTSV